MRDQGLTRKLKLIDAAQLLIETREDILRGSTSELLVRVSEAGKNTDAGLTASGVLVITGSHDWKDYLFYNLRPFRALPHLQEITQLASAELPPSAFHKGFLLHAARVKGFLGNQVPSFIVGHSLGAAAAQILGTSLRVPTICLASPQVVKRRFLKPSALRDPNHAQWNVFNLAWRKDFVTRGYRSMGLRCLGHRVVVDSQEENFGIDHFVKDYKKLIVLAEQYEIAGLPLEWPDTSLGWPKSLA